MGKVSPCQCDSPIPAQPNSLGGLSADWPALQRPLSTLSRAGINSSAMLTAFVHAAATQLNLAVPGHSTNQMCGLTAPPIASDVPCTCH